MKFCGKPFRDLYLDNTKGDVSLCPWMDPEVSKIGNMLEQEIEDIWLGEKAEKIRKDVKDNKFSYCRREACPRLQNNDLGEPATEKRYDELCKPTPRPKNINIAYDFVCNQYCETCREKVFTPYDYYKDLMESFNTKIAPYLDTAEMITTSGHGDPFASPYMMKVLENLRPKSENFKLLIETNGVFLDESHWERIKHLKDCCIDLILTSNSFDEFTYKHISRGGNFKKLMHNLEFIKGLREKGYINHYTSSFVIQDRNFRQMPEFARRSLEEFGFDEVVFKPVYQWGKMSPQVFWFKDVLNPKHPYHQEYLEILQDPILKDKRVYNFGGETEHQAVDYPCETKKK